jgi:hypothetical protein
MTDDQSMAFANHFTLSIVKPFVLNTLYDFKNLKGIWLDQYELDIICIDHLASSILYSIWLHAVGSKDVSQS